MKSAYIEKGAEQGFRFPFHPDTRTWDVVKVTTDEDGNETLEIVSTGHRSMGQAFRASQPEPEPE